MTIYGVYENDEYQECRFVGTLKEIAREFKCSIETVKQAVYYDRVFARNYKIVKLYRINEETDI